MCTESEITTLKHVHHHLADEAPLRCPLLLICSSPSWLKCNQPLSSSPWCCLQDIFSPTQYQMEHLEEDAGTIQDKERDLVALEILGLLPSEEPHAEGATTAARAPEAEGHIPPQKPSDASMSEVAVEAIFAPGTSHALSEPHYQSSFQSVLTSVEEAPNFEIPAELKEICRFYLTPGQPHLHISKEGISQITGVSAKNVEPLLNSVAQTLWQTERVEQALLEQAVVQSEATLLAYLEFLRFDETPMKVGYKQVLATAAPVLGSQGSIHELGQGSQQPSAATFESGDVLLPRVATTSKMFAVENRFVMVIKVEADPPAKEHADYIALSGTSLVPLRLVDRATGPTLRTCVAEGSPASTWAEHFPVKIRVATTDQALANMSAEKAILHDRGDSWGSLHLPCNMHVVAKAFTKTFSLCEQHISGMVNLALSLSMGGNMGKFREALADVAASRLKVLKGTPPPEVEAYRSFVLQLFGQTGRNVPVKTYLLQALPNGDWRKQDVVEVYIPATMDIDKDRIQQRVIQSLVLGLTGVLFRAYPRHRWVGADATTDQVAMLEAVHGLGSAAYRLFLQRMTSGAGPQPPQSAVTEPLAGTQQHQHGGPRPSGLDQAGVLDTAMGSSTFPLSSEQTEVPEDSNAAIAEGEASWTELSQINARQQRKAAQWLSTNPLPHLIGMRLCMRPLSHLLFQYLQRAGQHWELEQRAIEAQSLRLGKGPSRTSPLLEYLNLTSERQFLQDLQELLEPNHWSFIDTACWNLDFQTLFFRMTSRMGAMVQQLLVAPTQEFPLKFLDLFWDGQAGKAQLLSTSQCCLDPFSLHFLKSFPDEKLYSEEAEAIFSVIVQQAQTETVGLEWGHGRVSRLLRASSTQTHTPSMAFLNSQFLCSKHKQRQAATSTSVAHSMDKRRQQPPGSHKEPAAVVAKAKATRGGGGAWRAFVSQRTKGQTGRVNTAQLAAEYREAKEQRTPEFLQSSVIGEAATIKHRLSGFPSFGDEVRAIRRRRMTLNPAFHRGASSSIPGSSSQGDTWTAAVTESLKGQLQEVRREAANAARVQKQRWATFRLEIAGFLQEQRQEVFEKIFQAIPGALQLTNSMHPIPKVGMHVVEVSFDSVDKSATLAGWAMKNSRSCNLKATLDKHWSHVNEMLFHDKQTPLSVEPKKKGLCRTYGRCFCDADGKTAWRLRNHFLQALKLSFQRGVEERRSWLLEGFVVVCLCSMSEEEAAASSNLAVLASEYLEEEAPKDPMLASKKVWLHIALMYLKPYRPTFQLLLEEGSLQMGQTVLRQTGKFYTEFDLWFNLSLDHSWNLQFFRVLSTSAPQAELRPALCVVKPVSETSAAFWPIPKRARRRSGAKPKKGPTDLAGSSSHLLTTPASAALPLPEQVPESQAPDSEQESTDEALESGDEGSNDDSEDDFALEEMLEQALVHLEEDPAAQQAKQRAESEEEAALGAVLEVDPAEREQLLLHGPDDAGPANEPVEVPLAGIAVQEAADPEQPPGVPVEVGQPAVEVPVRVGLARNKAVLTATVEGGLISYYAQGFFTATCKQAGHGRCVLSRTSLPGTRSQQGRPLGLMMAWLAAGHNHDTKAQHWDKSMWPDQPTRLHHRGLLRQLPSGPTLLEQEKPVAPGEPEEPLELP